MKENFWKSKTRMSMIMKNKCPLKILIELSCCVILVVLSLFFYANFREETYLGIFLRKNFTFFTIEVNRTNFPGFFVDSFPSFAWTFVLCILLKNIWTKRNTVEKIFWILAPFIMMVFWEIGQYACIIWGTGDVTDILASFFAMLLVLLVCK